MESGGKAKDEDREEEGMESGGRAKDEDEDGEEVRDGEWEEGKG